MGGEGRGEETNLESAVHIRTEAKLVALADDCRVEKLLCALQLLTFRILHSRSTLTAEQPCTRTILAHIDMMIHL